MTTARVALFSGGRGSASIGRELVRRADLHTSVLVNAYDDGLSTGALRRLIPGLLGPSDFRKVFAGLLDLEDPVGVLLRHRLTTRDFDPSDLPATAADALRALDRGRATVFQECLRTYFEFVDRRAEPVDHRDFALGNLLIAGLFLGPYGLGDFNATITLFGRLCRVPAEVWNVSAGEPRWLVALTADGTLLTSESQIVAPHSAGSIADLYLLGDRPSASEWRQVSGGTKDQKRAWLSAQAAPAHPSVEATDALLCADVVVFGPGTQHSSLYPSYRIAAEAVRASHAPVKALVVNLDPDEDIRGRSAWDVVERALHYLGDPGNTNRVVTHVLHDPTSTLAGIGDQLFRRCADAGISVLAGPYRSGTVPATHAGAPVVDALLAALATPSLSARAS
ncbi:2-phospho-L-lactate transferase CofD family protein [Cryptosporangium sp. NPDC051539]|uniref:2-phospho-L-lactate transferase CofD family protein n=1 Tax=Cryptosporangium sp. NPDC051539 TaxID=3363962 RepID=UPI0037A6868E